MPYAEALELPRRSTDQWVAPDRETFSENFEGLELERVKQLLATDEGKKHLLEVMDADPALKEKMLSLVDRNIEQLEKKESFLMKVVKMPLHVTKAVGKTILKHPVLSAIGAAGIVALLIYFFGPAAGTVGMLGQRAIESFGEHVLGNVPVLTPEAGFEAAAELPAIGGLAGPEALEQAAQASESAGSLLYQNLEAAEAAGMSDGAMQTVTEAADSVIADPMLENINPVQKFFESFPPPPNP